MEEDSNVPTLVNPEGRCEVLAKQLEDFDVAARKAEAESLKRKYRRDFSDSFVSLCRLEGIGYGNLETMSDAELRNLDEFYIAKKDHVKNKWVVFFLLSNPLGWMYLYCSIIYEAEFPEILTSTIKYWRAKRGLQKIHGDKWFPDKKALLDLSHISYSSWY